MVRVVGEATQQYVKLASNSRKFRINEFMILENEGQSWVGEVVETVSFNRYIPEPALSGGGLIDDKVLEHMRAVGLLTNHADVHVARLRLLEEVAEPISVGIGARPPQFHEVRRFLVQSRPQSAWVLGVVRGTEELTVTPDLEELLQLFEDGQLLPQKGVPFLFDPESMTQYPHLGIFGGSGSGKSFGLRVVLEEVMKLRFPTIVLDPHYEMEFKEPLADHGPSFDTAYQVFQVGRDVGVSFPDLTGGELLQLLDMVSPLTEAMQNAALALFQGGLGFEGYRQRIANLKDSLEGGGKADPSVERFKDKVGGPGTLQALLWRLNALERDGLFSSQGVTEIEEALQLRKLVVVRGSLGLLRMFAGYLVKKIYDQRRQYRDLLQQGLTADKPFPPFMLVTDEAHNFVPKDSSLPAPARRVILEIAQEGRKYGVFLTLATQRVDLLDTTVTAQLNTKLIFRTTRAPDLDLIRAETDLSGNALARLPYLPSGTAFLSSATLGRTLPVRIRAAYTRSPAAHSPFAELAAQWADQGEQFYEAVLPQLPLLTGQVSQVLGDLQRSLGRSITKEEVLERLKQLAAEGRLSAEQTPFGQKFSLKAGEGS